MSSDHLNTIALKDTATQVHLLNHKKIWSDALVPDLKPTDEIRRDLKPKADSLILDLVRRGIEVSLQQLTVENPNRSLQITDFSAVQKIKFARTDSNTTTRNFCFYVHAPMAFKFFRDLFGITTECFRKSLCEYHLNVLQGYSHSGTLYTSHDDRYILKICQKKEAAFLEKFFPSYLANVTQHSKTLLPKFFGLYGYKEGKTHVYFLIMNNLVPLVVDIQDKYDLKGSVYNKRKSDALQRLKDSNECFDYPGSEITLKDLDFLERLPGGLYLKEKFYYLLMQSLERDCKILETNNIMDYSLLLGIHVPVDICRDERYHLSSSESFELSKEQSSKERKIRHVIGPFEARTSRGSKIHLYLGIIDILQSYTLRKKMEHFYKLFIYPSNTMSVVNPKFYAERFKSFLKQHVFKCIPELISYKKKERELLQKLLEDFPEDFDI